ncbi:MAG: MarR family winged helix-turn-helix transcriptional regulator [Ilumatobacter sp.]|jgi:DNA-binding MarR family transcriptional regulator|uniref:MarR family winged helix-turn-helix transcriptional regulator n=1 Tax=Ilumatobacter sp. TaxID=1967498 RepID=UPI00391B1D10
MTTTDAVATWERLVRFHRLATRAMDDHLRGRFGYSLDEYDVLHQIGAHGEPIQMGLLAERLLVANSSCNRIVGRLVDAGLLRRLTAGDDRRRVLVELTPSGRRLRTRMAAVHTRDIERWVGEPLSREAIAGLDEALRRLAPEDPPATEWV